MQLSEYSLEPLREDAEFVLYRAHAKAAELPSVLLLTPRSTQPSPETLQKIDYEYSLRGDLDSVWAVRPLAVSEYSGRTMLVLEDPGGKPLAGLSSGPMQMKQFLVFAAGLASAIGRLHGKKLIHKDVKPANVLADSATGQVRLLGFGISSRLRREHQPPEPPEFIAGTLAYMAPEQTGRMNRSIDSRSDLYGVGVTLYELLTGRLPFTASEPLEWVHCHIARHPVAPHERAEGVPASLSAIVMKLLAKTPEERYQTASGLEHDLRRCLAEWDSHGHIADFPPGQRDTPDRLTIPERLYGREREVETLLAAFGRVVAGGRPELVLVSGYSGIGKSAVVNELHRALVPPHGLFASGKFDQYKRDIPYATLAQAVQSLIRSLLGKNEQELGGWRDAIHEALDPNGQLMVTLVPELEVILGKQPPAPELPQQDAQRRFHLIFRRFIGVFARPEHPLALFLDDLQWLDAATLALVEDLLMQPDLKHMLLIGAYRDNEVGPTHPLLCTLRDMRQKGAALQGIVLAPLTSEDLEQFVADSLHCERAHARSLARLVYEKTSGNPFFAIQFLTALAEEGLLAFDHFERRWLWDLERIHAKGYTDNVVDLMVSKLSRLLPETRNALKQLACLGNEAEFRMLGMVYQDSAVHMHAALGEAVSNELIARSKTSYRFLHDRIREAAYSLIPSELRAEEHLRIGRRLASNTPPEQLAEGIFEIVNQLNTGSHLIESTSEREHVAGLNLVAGERAKTSAAYASALRYLHAAQGLLKHETWKSNYALVFRIELLIAECELLTTNMAAAENRLSSLADRAETAHDAALVTRLRLTLYTALDRGNRAAEVLLEYLRGRGTDWSLHPTREEVVQEYERIWSLLGSRHIESLIDLPLNSNPDVLDLLDVLAEIVTAAHFLDGGFLALVLCRMVCLSLEHGNSDGSCYAYVWFGALAGPHFGHYRAGFQFGKLGYDLVEQRGLQRYQARTAVSFATLIVPWTKHLKTARELQRRCFESANRVGDLTYAGYSLNLLYSNYLATGDPLDEVQREAETGLTFATRIQFRHVIAQISSQLGLIRTLRGITEKFGSFNDAHFQELQFEQHLANNPVLALPECSHWIRKLQARFLAGEYSGAIAASLNAKRLLWPPPAFLDNAEYHYYSALSLAASIGSATDDFRQEHFEALVDHQKQLEMWARYCPENFENRAALAGAEIARLEGRVLDAERLYEQAIRSAHTNGFVHTEAIAYELAARFYASRGFQRFADVYLLEARLCYQKWGADGKVAQLDTLYPDLRREAAVPAPGSTIMVPSKLLDLSTVQKVSQALSGEMDLEKLIDSLMSVILQEAGAERGILLVPNGDYFLIEAEATGGGSSVTVHQPKSAADSTVLPESVVRYVRRTQQSVVLEDRATQNAFLADSYILQHRVRSILCLPLINQGNLTRILYLENTRTPDVFTPARVAVLQALASQAAISLENSRLYRDLANRERQIRRLLESNVMGIVVWDLDGRVIDANDAFLRMVQYDREDLQAGLSWFDITPPDRREAHARIESEQLIAIGMMHAREKEYRRKDGSRVPVLIGAARFEDKPNQAVAYIVDLSEQKRVEEALGRSEAYLAEAQRQTHTGSCAMDGASKQTVYWSDEMFRLFGFEPEEGPPNWEQFLEKVDPEDRETLNRARETTFRTTGKCEVEFTILEPAGTIKHIHCIWQPLLGPSGQLLQVLGTMVDVTEHKRAEQVRERVRQLEADLAHIHRVSTVGELTASLAHEIKQPIGAAVTNAEVCLRLINRDQPDLPEAREAALEMTRDARRAADIVDRVRSLYQKGSSQLSVVDLNPLIDEMVHIMGAEASRHSVTIRTTLEPSLPSLVADRVQLQQVLMNLMLNGIEAMQDTGGELRATTQLAPDGQLLISVSDSGVGLPDETVERLFDAFFTTKTHGTGLGLAISRSVIESLGGRIWAAANPEKGATFYVTLPVEGASER